MFGEIKFKQQIIIMKQAIKINVLVLLLSLTMAQGFTQSSLYISSGTSFYITSGTNVYLDGLALRPSLNYNITGLNSVTKDAIAIPPPPASYIQRVYHLLSTLTGYSGDITIYYQDAELNGLNENLLNLDVYDGTTWNLYSATSRDATNNFVRTNSLSNISLNQLTLAGLAGPLPITLSGFAVQTNRCVATLNWKTASEQNSKHFEVQHSTDAINYTVVGIVAASGNSSSERLYSYNTNLVSTTNFFRLRMVDLDGSSKYSGVLHVNADCNNKDITLYPNPAKNNVTVKGIPTGSTLRLMGHNGQVLQTIKSTSSAQSLNISNLPAGAYIIEVIENNKITETLKMIKE